MHKTLRQMILGFGTFGTGTALLYLEVNPYLLVLTDTVVGVGMLFAAGSLTVDDLRLGRRRAQGEDALIEEVTAPAVRTEEPGGLRASLGRLRHPFRPAGKEPLTGKEEKEGQAGEIDRMLDTTLAGQSKRLISLAEGRGALPGTAAGTAAEPAGEDLLQQLSAGGISAQFPDDEAAEEEEADIPRQGTRGPGVPGEAATPPAGLEPEEGRGETQVDVLTLANEELGTDDLLSALRAEAMREKKKDDTSLLRDLKGVKVTGKQLLVELDSLVRDLRGR